MEENINMEPYKIIIKKKHAHPHFIFTEDLTSIKDSCCLESFKNLNVWVIWETLSSLGCYLFFEKKLSWEVKSIFLN